MRYFEYEKRAIICSKYRMAGAAGIEPASTVLETDALPLNHAPIKLVTCTGFEPVNACVKGM